MSGLSATARGAVASSRVGGYQIPAVTQSASDFQASGAATATLTTVAGRQLYAIVSDGVSAPTLSGWGSPVVSVNSGNARSLLYTRTAVGGSESAVSSGAGSGESVLLIEASGATGVLTGTAATAVDAGVGVTTLAIGSTTPAVPGLALAWVATNGTATSPSWSVGGLTLLDSTRIHAGTLVVAAGVARSATLDWTGTSRRAGGANLVFAAAAA